MKYSLAFDLGATSVRGILGHIEDGILKTEEVLRFSHDRIKGDGRSRWDWEKIIGNIEETILKYGENIESIGIDTWGVDFGIIDKEGNLLENPVSYRDIYNGEGFKEAQKTMSLKDIFMETGNQIMSINTLFQLLYLKKENKNYNKISKLLMLPDLINYYLTGKTFTEMTIASTTQIFDLNKKEFNKNLLEKYKINEDIFPEVIEPGRVVGSTKNSKLESLRKFDIPVISTASHDTASAVLLTKAYTDRDTLFLSCGTWSLIGCLSDNPIISEEVYENSLTNETGYNLSNMFFKNITGLYILEKLKTQLEKKLGLEISFEEISDYVTKCEVTDIVDVDNEVFQQDEFDAITEIDNLIGRPLDNDFDYFKVIYESLVEKYLQTIEKVKLFVKKDFKRIHMIGGGAKSKLLCQLIADKTGLNIIAGPFEATAYGNLIIQKMNLGEIKNLEESFKIIEKTSEVFNYKKN
ncbi:FGGY family carbohydrate kinase [Fusobacterium sp.]|uniref:rhamnulokinase n=1 Tax=Fusobacterium sp. TaxID=68766 RepID=UPI0026361DEF|nr:FGGY family carbohydrate kinase [Fusobacterium sp.]